MNQTKTLLLLLLASTLSATESFAQTVGTRFTVNGVTYQITVKDLDNSANNTVSIFEIAGSGAITIPQSVTNSQDYEVYKVTSVVPWVVDQIKNGVTEIVFPETLASIPEGSFRQCANPTFTKVTIPASCTDIGPQVFTVNASFKEFVVKSGNPKYKAVDGVLYTADGTTLHSCPSGKMGDLVIPEGVTTIPQWGIAQCTQLNNIQIPASLTNYNSASFLCSGSSYTVASGNPKLSTVDDGVLCNKAKDAIISYPHHHKGKSATHPYTIPAGIKTIESNAFYVSNVSTLSLNEVETIKANAFQYSYALETLNIGAKVKTIGESAFAGCAKLTYINVASNNPYYKAIDNVLFNKAGDHLIQCATKKAGNYEIPSGVKYIDKGAFLGTKDLASVTISKDVEEISQRAFVQTGIQNLTFESGSKLKTIGHQAFYEAGNLTSVTLPASLTHIASEGFRYMNALKSVTFGNGSQLATITHDSFRDNPNLESVTFAGTNSLQTIEYNAFAHDPKLKSFEIPASVTSIGQNAFLDTPSMTTVTFKEPASIATIGEGAFAYSGITAIDLPESVTKIEQQAFDNCKGLTTVHVPTNLTDIAVGAFNMCEGMEYFTVDDNNSKYSALAGMLCTKDKKELVVFPAGKSDSRYTLIPNFTTIQPYAFYGSDKLTNITFPASVAEIGNRAIALCDHLKSLSFMGTDNVPTLTEDIMFQSGNSKDVTIYVRKKWYENSSNSTTIDTYNSKFKEVHPSFVQPTGYDRGTEFFPTSTSNVGVISFYTPRTSVIINPTVTEENSDASRGKTWQGSYSVSSILDYAYQNDATVEDIVVLADIGTVGLDAFKAGNQLKGIYFVGDTPAALNSTDYGMNSTDYPFNANQAIYVKQSKANDYKTEWEVDGHSLGITHKIPQQTNKEGGTVCFPFDVDYPSDGGIVPYIPIDYSHAHDTSNPFVRAYSVDNGYVPAFVGALFRSKDVETTSSYCQMDENQAHDTSALTALGYSETADNRMVGAVEDTPIT
ncbi:MAG: leucine-rich repeat protein, partial [Prevotella sp.]